MFSCIVGCGCGIKICFFKIPLSGSFPSKNLNPVLLEITLTSWILALIASFVLGISKAGLKGIAMVTVTLMALAFGARESTGLIVPMLLVGDVFAVLYYSRHTRWQHILRFAPWMVSGILLGTFLGKDLPASAFKIWMAVIILASVVLMYWWDLRKSKRVPGHWAFAGGMGIVAGLATMLGNLAGAFTNLYFLAMRLPKNEFIGTAAWLFLITNLVKLPLHVFVWETISWESLLINLKLLPGIFLGLFTGVRLVKIIREGFYRKMILILTAIGAALILLR